MEEKATAVYGIIDGCLLIFESPMLFHCPYNNVHVVPIPRRDAKQSEATIDGIQCHPQATLNGCQLQGLANVALNSRMDGELMGKSKGFLADLPTHTHPVIGIPT